MGRCISMPIIGWVPYGIRVSPEKIEYIIDKNIKLCSTFFFKIILCTEFTETIKRIMCSLPVKEESMLASYITGELRYSAGNKLTIAGIQYVIEPQQPIFFE